MPRFVKVVLSVTLVFGLLLAVAAGSLVLLVDPNDHKPRIAELAGRHLGRPLSIDGEIRLSLFPVTRLVTGRIVLPGPDGFDGPPLARAARLRVDVDPFLLVRGLLSVTRLEVEGLEVHLVRLENGRTSWEGLTAETGKRTSGGPLLPQGLSVAGVAVKDGELTWTDRTRALSFGIRDLALSLEDIEPGEPSRLALSFTARSDRTRLEADARVKGRLTLRRDRAGALLHDLQLDIGVQESVLPGETAHLQLASTIEADWEGGALRIDDLQGSLVGTELRGWVHLENLSRPALSFDLDLGPLDLDARGFRPGRAETGAADSGRHPDPRLPTILERLEAEGRLKVKRVRWSGLDVHDLELELAAKEGRLRVDPFRARFSNGALEGGARVDLAGERALPALRLRVEGVEVGPVARALAGRREMTGTANLDLDLRSTGLDPGGWPAALNGSASFEVLNGTVGFFGVPQNAEKSPREQVNPFQETDRPTPFERIDGTLQARNGILTNRDLRFRSQVLSAAGDGMVDLRQRRVGYDLAVLIPVLPDVWVRVAGPLDAPAVRVQPLKMLTRSVQGLGKEALDLPGSVGRGARTLGKGVADLPGSLGSTIKGLFE